MKSTDEMEFLEDEEFNDSNEEFDDAESSEDEIFDPDQEDEIAGSSEDDGDYTDLFEEED